MVGKKGLGPRPGGNKVAVGIGGVFCRRPVLAVVNAAPSNKTLLPFPMQLVDPRLTNQVGWGGVGELFAQYQVQYYHSHVHGGARLDGHDDIQVTTNIDCYNNCISLQCS